MKCRVNFGFLAPLLLCFLLNLVVPAGQTYFYFYMSMINNHEYLRLLAVVLTVILFFLLSFLNLHLDLSIVNAEFKFPEFSMLLLALFFSLFLFPAQFLFVYLIIAGIKIWDSLKSFFTGNNQPQGVQRREADDDFDWIV